MKLPVGHRWCNHCGGDGKAWSHVSDEIDTCVVCKGKGYWNRQDIRDYHELAPNVCKQSCGEEGYVDPYWMPGEPYVCPICKAEYMIAEGQLDCWEKCQDELFQRTKELLEKHK